MRIHLVFRPLYMNTKNLNIAPYCNNFIKLLLGKLLRRIRHYRHNNELKFKIYSWHNGLIRAKNLSNQQRVYE